MNKARRSWKRPLQYGNYGILYLCMIFWLLLFITNPDFRGLAFYQNILTQASLNGFCGIGMTFAIISGDVDLSVASQVALNGVVLALLMPVAGIMPAVLAVLVLGILMGCGNGLLVAKLKIPAFITTLGMQMGYRSIAQLVNSTPVAVESGTFKGLAGCRIGGILPLVFLLLVLLAAAGTVILRRTRLGRNILAIGNSKEAAAAAGISIPRTQIWIYLLVGFFTALSSIMMVSSLGSANYGMQSGLESAVISGVVLGGTALAGGKGSIFNTIGAAVFLATISSGMDSFGIGSGWQKVVQGILLVTAFSISEIHIIISKYTVRYKTRKQMK